MRQAGTGSLRTIVSFRIALLGLLAMQLPSIALRAQSTPAKPAAEQASSSGFSIETEMLTYRALESNSEAVACDVARYLFGSPADAPGFKASPNGPVCSLAPGDPHKRPGVVILPFDSGLLTEIEMWRLDMQRMSELEERVKCELPTAPGGDANVHNINPAAPSDFTTRSTAAPLPFTTPVTSATAAMSGVFALLSSDRTISSVSGTVQDQALMEGISRELRAVNIPVLMPSAFAAHPLDPAQSPFLVAWAKLKLTRACLQSKYPTPDPSIAGVTQEMDEFFATLSGAASGSNTSSGKPANPTAPGTTSPTTGTPPQTTGSTVSHWDAVLSADGLAQRLGADPKDGSLPDSTPVHLLLVKALESGGSVSRFTNVLGTKISYSGGAVDTYALFDLKGTLECSGNVYDYAGMLPSKKFRKELSKTTLDPANQVIFQRGGCQRSGVPTP